MSKPINLYVIALYINGRDRYEPGEVLEVTPERAEFLQNDSPGCFSLDPPKVEKPKAKPKPKAAKQQKTPAQDKAVKGSEDK